MESRHNSSLRQIHFDKDGQISFYFKDAEVRMAQDEIVQEMERIKPGFLNLVRRLYGKSISTVKLDGNDIRLGYSGRPASTVVKKDDLYNSVRNACELVIETKCVTHGIPLYNKELLECLTLEESIGLLDRLEEGISHYCPNGNQPTIPVVFNVDVDKNETIKAGFVEIPLSDVEDNPSLRRVYKRLLKPGL